MNKWWGKCKTWSHSPWVAKHLHRHQTFACPYLPNDAANPDTVCLFHLPCPGLSWTRHSVRNAPLFYEPGGYHHTCPEILINNSSIIKLTFLQHSQLNIQHFSPDNNRSNGSRKKTAQGAFSGISFLVLHEQPLFPQDPGTLQSSAFSLQNTLLHSVVATLPMVQKLKLGSVVEKWCQNPYAPLVGKSRSSVWNHHGMDGTWV